MSSSRSIFISYRRSDAIAETERIYDWLVRDFGREHVFKDVDDIPLGFDFTEYLDQAVGQCQVLLAIIGKNWVTVTEADGSRRLDNPDDFVRIEVESALKRGISVIPVLLEGVSMPNRAQLPASLHPLVRRNGTQVGYDPRFRADMDRLIKGLKSLMRAEEVAPEAVAEALAEDISDAIQEVPKPLVKPSLPTFSFETVYVDARGKVTQREQRQAAYRQEDLGQGISLDMVAVPGGSFQMGSPKGQGEDDERPQHKVTVEPFLMGKYSVTQAQWRAVAALPKIEGDLQTAPSWFTGDNRPVECVSWNDAVEFCRRLARSTGHDYRLPSEAEWEYACRAGTTTAFYSGDTITSDLANYNATEIYGSGPEGEYRDQTTDVGSFPANGFGLYDMHGNVCEWCQDDWHSSYEGAPTDGSVRESSNSNSKMLRGGSWRYNPRNCRSAFRSYNTPDYRYYFVGFRVSCSAPRTLA